MDFRTLTDGVDGYVGGMTSGGPIGEALIVVDMQRAFIDGDGAVHGAAALLGRVERLVERARAARVPVILVQNDGPPGAPDESGSPGWALAVAPSPGDWVVRKTDDDAFDGTELQELLREAGTRRVVVVGVYSEMCVAATARGARSRGLVVVLPHDGHATVDTPAWPGVAEAVPAPVVSRVAEWSLGDQVVLVPSTSAVEFRRPPGPDSA